MKNKTPATFTFSFVLILLVVGLVYKLTHKNEDIASKPHVKKFAERKTFIPKSTKPVFQPKSRPVINVDSKEEVVISGRNYMINTTKTAKRVVSKGMVQYKEQTNKPGMPILTNKNNGMSAVFTGNLMVKTEDSSKLNQIIDRFGLKLIQEFKHLGTYYLGAKDPSIILRNMQRINEVLEDSRVEYELIENPIKLK